MTSGLLLLLAACAGECTDCDDWFTEQFGYDEVDLFACSLSMRRCEATEATLGVRLADADGATRAIFEADEDLSIIAWLRNDTGHTIAHEHLGCVVSSLYVAGGETGLSAHYDCFSSGTVELSAGQTEEVVLDRSPAAEWGVGTLRAQATFWMEAGTCCPCASAVVVPDA